MNKKSINVRRVIQIMSLMCIVIFFCPTMLVSCSGYGLEISAKDAVVGSYGEYQMGEKYPIMIITLIIPVFVIFLLFLRNSLKDKTLGIIISLSMVTDICMWVIYSIKVNDVAELAFGEAKPTEAYILNMILMFGILILGLLVVLGRYDDTSQSAIHSLSFKAVPAKTQNGTRTDTHKILEFSDFTSSIPNGAFRDDQTLTDIISIPERIRFIGDNAFRGCNIRKVELPKGLLGIGSHAFSDSSLEEITIPEDMRVIETLAFSNCKQLKKIVLPDSVKSIGAGAFSGCEKITEIILPQGISVIEEGAFSGCSSLEKVKIPASVAVIKENAFAYCRNLKEIILSEASKTHLHWGKHVFSECRNFVDPATGFLTVNNILFEYVGDSKNIIIPSSIKSIASGAFELDCTIESVTIPASVTSVGNEAFYECPKLRSVKIEGNPQIGDMAFFGCSALREVTLPKDAEIGIGAFTGCIQLADQDGFVIVNGIVNDYVGDKSEVKIPFGVREVAVFGFQNLNVKSIELPAVQRIGEYAFANCPALETIIADGPTYNIAVKALKECGADAKVHVVNRSIM